MKNIPGTDSDDLVSALTTFSEGQYECLLDFRYKKYNKLYREIESIADELQQRGHLYFFVQLYSHKNPQARFNAAVATLGLFPGQAVAVLEQIRDRHEFPTAGYVNDILRGMKAGTFMPRSVVKSQSWRSHNCGV